MTSAFKRVDVLLKIFLIIFALQLLLDIELIIFIDIHMYFINEPTDKFMRVMMFIIIKKCITSPNPPNKSFMINNTSVTLRISHAFKQVMQFIDQIILFFVARLPEQYLLPEWFAVE